MIDIASSEQLRIADLYASDEQFREARPLASVTDALREVTGLAQILETVMVGYADRPAIGERVRQVVPDPTTGRLGLDLLPVFETITYRELWRRVGVIAAEWHNHPEYPVDAGDFVCTIGFTSGEHVMVDLATTYLGLVAVPLQTSASQAALSAIVSETNPRIVASSIDMIDVAAELAIGNGSVTRLIVFDYHEVDTDRERLEAARRRVTEAGAKVTIESLSAVLERGRTLPAVPIHQANDGATMSLLIYTSGSTGTPKGAIYTDRLISSFWAAVANSDHPVPAITVNYLPLSHQSGRSAVGGTFVRGGTAYFTARSDLSTLSADIALVRPTDMVLVPRVSEMFYQAYQSELERRAADTDDLARAEVVVRTEFRESVFGGRVVRTICGAAPLSPEIRNFLESCLEVPAHEGYGSTEAGGITVDDQVQRPPVLDYKLVDVPELGYFTTDSPHPRGELRVKTQAIMPGYYKQPEVTANVFDEDGFYKTGDIMAEIGPDHLRYVDRTNNVIKLSQGDFVAIARLESVFVTSPLIHQIFLYGSSERAYLLAVIVPTVEAVESAGHVDDTMLIAALQESLQQVAKQAGLESYEVPRDILIEYEPFGLENGLLTDSGKIQRPKLKYRYGDQLEELYVQLAERQVSELRALRREGRSQPVLATVARAAQSLLGCASADLEPEAHFADLGGDSLSALTFSDLLHEIYEVRVPVSTITGPAADLHHIADYIETELHSTTQRPTVADVHGADRTLLRASDLTLDRFIDARTLAAAATLPHPDRPARVVLLTGANGYLGRFLCLDWLERLAGAGGTLVCLVRGSDAADATRRLEETFDTGDEELLRHFQELAAETLEVLPGDLGQPQLGLDEPTWARLTGAVDLIIHPGALVNHVLPYDELFGPNVAGTAELIRLAITDRIKPFAYLSSLAAGVQVPDAQFNEVDDIRVMSPVCHLDDAYASGYGASKWAGEVLLHEAHELCGLPSSVFRSDMILAHSRFTGQLNVPDIFTRFIFSLLVTGVAPRSFYRTDAPEQRPRAHYDGLPADFTAQAVATLAEQTTTGFHTFHVVNPHKDGISLDVVVDWLREAGHPIELIDDYGEWFTRFRTAMRALPESRRRHSLLPLLKAYEQPAEPIDGSAVSADRFRDAVKAADIGTDGDIPHMSADLINQYVAGLRQLKLL